MNQPIQDYLEQALRDFEVALASHHVHESYLTRGEKLIGAKWFVGFILGKPLPDPFANMK